MKEQDVPDGQLTGASLKPYPYADAKTYEFLQTVVRDGTQHTLSRYIHEEAWVRYKNITGIYFSCNITKGELGDMYGMSKQAIDQIISKTLRRFWDNSIGSDQMQFPIDSLSTENPATKHRIHGFSGGDQIRFESLISSGADDEEVVKGSGVSLDLVRQTMRRKGKREQITSNRKVIKRIVNQLETLPVENYKERQKAIDQVTNRCYRLYRKSFANISDVAAILGQKKPVGRSAYADKFVIGLKDMGIPVGAVVGSKLKGSGAIKERRQFFIHKKDFLRLKKKRGLATNPSEIPDPIS